MGIVDHDNGPFVFLQKIVQMAPDQERVSIRLEPNQLVGVPRQTYRPGHTGQVMEKPPGQGPLVFIPAAPQDRRWFYLVEKVLEEGCLTYPGRAFYRHDPQRPLMCADQGLLEHRQLGLPTDEGRFPSGRRSFEGGTDSSAVNYERQGPLNGRTGRGQPSRIYRGAATVSHAAGRADEALQRPDTLLSLPRCSYDDTGWFLQMSR